MGRGRLYHGTSSWSEKAWIGPFYPPGTRPADMLSLYAAAFPAVEIDATYYRVPTPSTVRGWRDATPPAFRLAAKFPRAVVHGGDGSAPDPARLLLPEAVGGVADRFLEVMDLLGERCGPLLLQFPYFNRTAFPAPEPFLERLDRFLQRLPPRFRYAVEVRNPRWLRTPLFDLLRRHRTARVLADLPYLPPPPPGDPDAATTDFAYLRLIGDRKATEAAAERFDRLVVDRSASLEVWAERLRELLDVVPEVHAYANNHFAGFGPETIRELVRRVG